MSIYLTDLEIDNIITLPKYYYTEDLMRARWNPQDGHRKKDLPLRLDESTMQLNIFWRQNLEDQLDFTVGLAYRFPDSNVIINLIRCNGNSHTHKNSLENTKFDRTFHVHKATRRYMELSPLKAENFAQVTNAYREIEGAFRYLKEIAHIAERKQGMRQLYDF
ncbi:hypothetical protein Thermo_00820 [Thermoplasmatales archaeon]|nr:hypothetical protein Thermo_00820 [Thermoplasmatales archaeon]